MKKMISLLLAVLIVLSFGTAAVADDIIPSPDPEETSVPETPQPTEAPPQPTETPQPTATPAPELIITKQPTAENVQTGDKIVFIAHADNKFSVQWFIVSKDGNTTIPADGMSAQFPGVVVSGCYDDTLVIQNATLKLSGCSAYAVFTDAAGNQQKTNQAMITVTQKVEPTPTPTPKATPAPKPTAEIKPTTAPSGAPTAQPVDSPKPTVKPAVQSLDSEDFPSKANSNKGAKVFLVLIGLVLVSTAVILVLYVKGIIRLDWLEDKLNGKGKK